MSGQETNPSGDQASEDTRYMLSAIDRSEEARDETK